MIELRLTHPAIDFWVDVRLLESEGPWLAVADLASTPEVAVAARSDLAVLVACGHRQDQRVSDELALDEGPAPLSGNKAIEGAAIAFVMDLERAYGREPVDRRNEAAFAADIESLPRIIEVKAVGGSQRGWFLPLEVPQVNAARTNPDFYVYIVDNVRQGDPSKFGLKVLGGERLARLLEKAKQRSYYEVPVPVAEYDSAPGREAL